MFWNSSLSSSPAAGDIPTSTLVGMHPGGVPGGDPDSATAVGMVPLPVLDPLDDASDTSFNVAFTISGTRPGLSTERFWIGQFLADDPYLEVDLDMAGDYPFPIVVTTLASGFDPISGLDLEIVLEERSGGGFDAFLEAVPAPGALGLLGIAGLLGARRRRVG